MKKIYLTLFCLIPCLCLARLPSSLWQVTDLPNATSSTVTETPDSNTHLVIKSIIHSSLVAGYIYFYHGTKSALFPVSPRIYTTIYTNPVVWEDLNWVTAKGAPLKVWANADMSADDVLVTYQKATR